MTPAIIRYTDDRTALFAKFIATKYGLKITAEEAEKLLQDQPKTSEAQMR